MLSHGAGAGHFFGLVREGLRRVMLIWGSLENSLEPLTLRPGIWEFFTLEVYEPVSMKGK